MAKFHIDGPDGSTYEVDAPDEVQAVAAFKKMQQGATSTGASGQGDGATAGEPDAASEDARIAANDPGYIKGIAAHLAQGATFGLSDEILAGIKSGAGFLGDYGQALQHERDITHDFEEAHPVISALSEIVGSLPLAGGVARAGGSLVLRSAEKAAAKNLAARVAGRSVGALEKATDVGKRIGAGALEGAGYGAAYGAGTAEGGPEERLQGAVDAAPLGAATGGAISVVAPVAGAVARKAGGIYRDVMPRWAGGRTDADAATRRVAGAVDANTAEGRIGEAQKIGQNLGIADVSGAPAQDLLKTAATRSGERGDIAARANLSELSAVDRVKALAGESLNAPEGAYQAAKNMIMDARSNAAEPYYKRFYAEPVEPSDELTSILSTPNGRSALAQAKRNAANRREPALFDDVDEDGNIIKGKVPNAQALDETKRVLDAAVSAAKAKPEGSPFAKPLDTPESRAIASVRDDLVKHLDTIGTPDKQGLTPYAKARDVSGANIREDEAIEFGRKALNTDPRVIARRMGDPAVYGRDKVFSDPERELSRIGLADAIFAKLEKTGSTAQALASFFKSPAQVARIKPFFSTDAEFKAFQKQMLAESLKGRTNEIAARASGAPRVVKDESPLDAGGTSVARTTIMFGARAGAVTAIAKALSRIGGMTPKVADEIGRQLMTRDPAEVQRVIAQLHALERTKLSKEAKRIRTRRIVTDVTAGTLGRASSSPAEYRGVE